eukprot:TRINITY_DN986_c0_g1_i2.p1 TRINITY_DN986_c0_g1~~TRINITY_DN986_c0_g1_i2.p1  ORF type:complete len:293 (-),score=73.05 TRINITY_DN986_c0_g1_i2:333-1211(-)
MVIPSVIVAGKLKSAAYHQAKKCIEYLTEGQHRFRGEVLEGMVETDYEEFLVNKRRQLAGEALTHTGPIIVYTDDNRYLGGIDELLAYTKQKCKYNDKTNKILYERAAKVANRTWREATKHTFAFMEFKIEGQEQALGRVVFELYDEHCPKTVENFIGLCGGGGIGHKKSKQYLNSPIHRVVPGGWVQGGDVDTGSGDGGESIWGGTFADECYAVAHDKAGILGMANNGRHTNGSQFYVTLKAMPHWDRSMVAFGRVISGMRVLKLMEKMEALNQRPLTKVYVSDCGIDQLQ